jgi:hypothetical protein
MPSDCANGAGAAHFGADTLVTKTKAGFNPSVNLGLEEANAVAADGKRPGEFAGINQPVHLGLRHTNSVENHGRRQETVLRVRGTHYRISDEYI